MPTPQANTRLDADLITAARRKLGLPEGTPTAQIIRAAFLRFLGHDDADGQPAPRTNPGGRPAGYSPKTRTHA